jgi:hypothetical protein
MPPLEQIIEDLLADADHKAGQAKTAEKPEAAKVRLGRGLVINLRREGTQYVLTLWRNGAHPDFQEWNTVCSHWPYPVGAPNPHKGKFKEKYYLQGRVPGHPKTTMIGQTWT